MRRRPAPHRPGALPPGRAGALLLGGVDELLHALALALRERALPICVLSSAGSPTTSLAVCCATSSTTRSWTDRSTRMRLRAVQFWPALSKTDIGVAAANFSRSASAKTTLGLLPPSSSEIRFTLFAASRMISWPVVVSPVKATLPDARVRGEGRAGATARAGDDVHDTRREACLEGQLGQANGRQRRPRGGLEDARVAGGERRAKLPRGHVLGEVPGHDQADHADWLAQREVEARHRRRDRLAEVLVRGAGVVLEHEADREGLAARATMGLPTFSRSIWASSSLVFLTRSANFWSVRPRLAADHFRRGRRTPFVRRLDGAVDIGLAAQRDAGDDLARGGLVTSKVWPSSASTCSPPMSIFASRMGASSAAAAWSCSIVIGQRF